MAFARLRGGTRPGRRCARRPCGGPTSAGCRSPCPTRPMSPALVDECTEVARRLGAVNCIVNRDDRLLGTNTDGEGFVASLARGAAFTPAGKRCLVIGAGGAARAVVLALAEAGASQVAVLNRTPERAAAAAALAGAAGSVVPPRGRAGSPEEKGRVESRFGRPGRQRHAVGHGGRVSRRAQPDWLVAPQLLHAGPGGGRPGLRAPTHPVAGRGRRGGCPAGGRARHAGPPGGGSAGAVDGAAGSRRGHVAGAEAADPPEAPGTTAT